MMIRLIATLAAGILALAACDSGGDGGGVSAGGGSTDTFCALADDVQGLDELGEGIDPTDFDALTNQLDEFNDVLDDAVEAAPDEIRDDVELIATTVSDLFEAMRGPLQELSENPEAAAQNPEIFQQLQEAQPTPEEEQQLEEASQRIEQFVEEECGIDPDSGGDSDGGDSDGGDSGTDESDGGGEGEGGNPLSP